MYNVQQPAKHKKFGPRGSGKKYGIQRIKTGTKKLRVPEARAKDGTLIREAYDRTIDTFKTVVHEN